jgi:hypothetical protein
VEPVDEMAVVEKVAIEVMIALVVVGPSVGAGKDKLRVVRGVGLVEKVTSSDTVFTMTELGVTVVKSGTKVVGIE